LQRKKKMKKIIAIILTVCFVVIALWFFVFKKQPATKTSPRIVKIKIPALQKIQEPASKQPLFQKTETKPAITPKIKIAPQLTDKNVKKSESEKAVKKFVIKKKAAEAPAPKTEITEKFPTKSKVAKKPASEDMDMAYRERKPFHPYSLRISSNRLKKTAQSHYNYYKNKGLSPFFVRLDLGQNGVWWNLHVGHYKTQDEAEKVKKANKLRDALIKKMSYANLIGEFTSKKEMEVQFQSLEKSGYYPYIIRGHKNTILLFVGDFFEQKGAAERNQKRLTAEGIKSRFVKR